MQRRLPVTMSVAELEMETRPGQIGMHSLPAAMMSLQCGHQIARSFHNLRGPRRREILPRCTKGTVSRGTFVQEYIFLETSWPASRLQEARDRCGRLLSSATSILASQSPVIRVPPDASISTKISCLPGFGTGISSHTGAGLPLCLRHVNMVAGRSATMTDSEYRCVEAEGLNGVPVLARWIDLLLCI